MRIQENISAPLRGLAMAGLLILAAQPSFAQTHSSHAADPREELSAGLYDAGVAMHGLELLATRPAAAALADPAVQAPFTSENTDLAFRGNYVFQGNYYGFQIWNVADPANPVLTAAHVCPGGQGDVSVWGNLLFVSVEETRARVDCGTDAPTRAGAGARFMGVRIFDISDFNAPRQVAAVQTCRGSHTHTLVPDPRDPNAIYVYNSGTSRPRPAAELAGCLDAPADPRTSYFSIDVIHVPLAAPQNARVVSSPRIFSDPNTGALGGLWPGGMHGPGTQTSSQTNRCHDITVYPEYGIAAGACAGNGILLDIRDPANPVRTEAVADPNFAFWHSATFSNDASTVIFTDEWGGGNAPRCRATDRPEWGANAIFDLRDGRLTQRSYYKLPAPQTAAENCVAHNGSLIPVPGRDIKVQGWYQGGISIFDFTDPASPFEIAYFDRGPVDSAALRLAGHWSAYWYNGHIYGSEIGRGLDVLRLTPSEHLSANEIAAAKLVRMESFNPQMQEKLVWPASFVVARAYIDQLARNRGIPRDWLDGIIRDLDQAERLAADQQRRTLAQLASRLEQDASRSPDGDRVVALAAAVRALSVSQR
jgi:hypothetical protein